MTQRKYSIDEIDSMRNSISWLQPSGIYHRGEREDQIERELRTHMLNGTSPEELRKKMQEVIFPK